MKTNRFLLSTVAVATGLVISSSALAQSPATGTLNAKIVITANCAIVGTNTDLDFGSKVSTEGTNVISASNGGFSVNCTPGTTYNIGLQSAASGMTTDGKGVMKGTSGNINTIGYQLYQDSSTTVWGNSPTGTINTKGGTGTGAAIAYTVYGKTTSTLNVPADTYSDIVNINVYY